MKHIGTKVIETERLILRSFTMNDAQPMFDNWASDPEVTKFLTWPAHSSVDVTSMILKDWVAGYEKPDHYNWAITLKEEGNAPVGNISAVQVEDDIDSVEIGYCMGRRCWGKGIMAEALKAVIDFFMAEVDTNRVHARHDTANPNSGKVMAKAGMTFEGVLRQGARNNQGIVDIACYSILKSEWSK